MLTDHCSLFQDGAPGPEPAGSEGAKFRLWVKSKGLTLSRGPGVEAGTPGTEAGETEDTSLYLPTGTEQVRARNTQIIYPRHCTDTRVIPTSQINFDSAQRFLFILLSTLTAA